MINDDNSKTEIEKVKQAGATEEYSKGAELELTEAFKRKEEAEKENHKRKLVVKSHAHRVSVWMLYGLFGCFCVIIFCAMWNFLLPEKYHWMNKDRFSSVLNVAVTLIAGYGAQQIAKYIGK